MTIRLQSRFYTLNDNEFTYIYIRLAIILYHKQIFQLGVISYGILKFYHEVENTPVQQVLCIYHMGVFDRWDSITKLILHRDHLEISSFVHILKEMRYYIS